MRKTLRQRNKRNKRRTFRKKKGGKCDVNSDYVKNEVRTFIRNKTYEITEKKYPLITNAVDRYETEYNAKYEDTYFNALSYVHAYHVKLTNPFAYHTGMCGSVSQILNNLNEFHEGNIAKTIHFLNYGKDDANKKKEIYKTNYDFFVDTIEKNPKLQEFLPFTKYLIS